MKMRFFDFEVFPHWWCCTFGDLPDGAINENIKDNFVVVRSDELNARDKLISLMKEDDVCVAGYNIKHYDLSIANAIYQGFTPEQVKIVNDIIIRPDTAWSTKEHIRLQPFAKRKLSCVYQDLMDDSNGSLKEKEAILGMDIMESEVPFDKEDLTEDDKLDVIKYNKHDVYASIVLYTEMLVTYTNTKLTLGRIFNIPEKVCRASTNANIIAKVLKAVRGHYGDTDCTKIVLPKQIDAYCRANLPPKILDYILNNQEGITVKLFDNTVVFGNGGIHSTYDSNIYVESDDEWVLLNVDATSYYPSMLIKFKTLSRAVTEPKIFEEIFAERVRIKHKENKTEEDEELQRAYKLVLNTTFGASGNKYLDLYDPYMCSKTCRVGQIFLASLACKLHNTIPGIKIIQTNTDGILVYIRRKDIPTLEKCQAEWTAVSGINMDTDHVTKIWQRDVNNYILLKEEHGKVKIKRKGAWLNDKSRHVGYIEPKPLTAFACAKAATDFLLDGKDVVESIFYNTNFEDFVMTCTKGPTYRGVVHRMYDGSEKELFRCNRVVGTTDERYGKLYKVKMYKGKLSYTQMPNTPDHCVTVNAELSGYNLKMFKIDYMYYIERTADMLDIPWRQIKGLDVIRTHQFDFNYQ